MSSVDISGIDKVSLLHALWKNSKPAIFFSMNNATPPPFDNEKAMTAVQKYINYYDGRCIKCDLSGDTVDPRLYDRDFGSGAVQRIVDQLRQQRPIEVIVI